MSIGDGHIAQPQKLAAGERYVLAGLGLIVGATLCWWTFALVPIGRAAPEWIARTRYICFGTDVHGVPDAAGWLMLIAQPVGMLLALLIGWRDSARSLLHRAQRSRGARRSGAVAFVVILVIGALGAWRVGTLVAQRSRANAPIEGYSAMWRPAPPLELTDQFGATRSLHGMRGRTTFVAFVYAHCETVCPLVIADALNAQRLLGVDAQGSLRTGVLLVTLDPWRDTPARLPHLAAQWHLPRNAYVLSGDTVEVERALERWQVVQLRDTQTGEVTHVPVIYVVDGSGVIRFSVTGGVRVLARLAERL